MKNAVNDIFEQLKESSPPVHFREGERELYFQLQFDSAGAFITPVNRAGAEICPDQRLYNGPTRDLLKAVSSIKVKNSFNINWETPADRVYLSDSPALANLLEGCKNLVDKDFNTIEFSSAPAELSLVITEEKKLARGKFALKTTNGICENISVIDETHIFSKKKIHKIPSLGPGFRKMGLFETVVGIDKLDKYLSLLFSNHSRLSVDYRGYRQVYGNLKETGTAIFFETVDKKGTLYLRVGASLPHMDSDFLEQYRIERIVSISDADRSITIRELSYGDISSCIAEVRRLLKKQGAKTGNTDFYVENNLFIIPAALAKKLIREELGHLISKYVIMGAEKLQSYKVISKRPALSLNLSSGIDFLRGDATLNFGDQSLSLLEALAQYDRKNYISLKDGTTAVVDREYMGKLARLFKKEKKKVAVSFFDLPLVEELIEERKAESEKSFQHSREIFMGFGRIRSTKPRLPILSAEMRDYQKQGFKWAKYLQKHGFGGCLADDMGLGKTLQAIALMASVYPKEKKSSLVIMPRSLLFNWEEELKKFAPNLSFYRWYQQNRDMEKASKSNLILTTYAMVRNHIQVFREMRFHYVVIDESQHIKNIDSKISRAVMLLDAEHRLALSGTPVENNLAEVYALFRFLNPAMFGTPSEFMKNYMTPIMKEDDRQPLMELRKKIYPFILRRLKADVPKDLPDKTEKILRVEMSEAQKNYYEERRRAAREMVGRSIKESGIAKSQFSILQALGELRRIASVPEIPSDGAIVSPKREILIQHLRDLAESGHKVLVFANFLDALSNIGEDLDSAGIAYLKMTGATRERKLLVEKFQTDDKIKVFLMTLKTGGVGLNLTSADYVFIYDPWWNSAAENQAVDRSHRMGQKNKVFSYKLITRGTIEEKILELQERKKELFESLIESDNASIKSMNEADVAFVFGE